MKVAVVYCKDGNIRIFIKINLKILSYSNGEHRICDSLVLKGVYYSLEDYSICREIVDEEEEYTKRLLARHLFYIKDFCEDLQDKTRTHETLELYLYCGCYLEQASLKYLKTSSVVEFCKSNGYDYHPKFVGLGGLNLFEFVRSGVIRVIDTDEITKDDLKVKYAKDKCFCRILDKHCSL